MVESERIFAGIQASAFGMKRSNQKRANHVLKNLCRPITYNGAFSDTMPIVDLWNTMGMARLLIIKWLNDRLGSGYRFDERKLSASIGGVFYEQTHPLLPSSRSQVWACSDYNFSDCKATGRYLFERDH